MPINKNSEDGLSINLYVGMNADSKIVGIESRIANHRASIREKFKNLPPL